MDQEKTYKWIQERLRDLQSGRITDADLLRLNELAKSDPFLSDALAGYRMHPHVDHTTRLNTIAHRVRVKKEVKRKWLMPAIAASLLAVAGIWTLVDLTSREKTMMVSAESTQPSPVIESDEEDMMVMTDSNAGDIAVMEEAVAEGAQEPSGLRAHAQSKIANETTEQNKDGVMLSDAKVNESDDNTVADELVTAPASRNETMMEKSLEPGVVSPAVAESSVESAKNADYDEGLYANQMDPSFMRRRVNGQIIDIKGEPLHGAMIGIPTTNLITSADHYGRFEVFLPTPKAELEINLPGYNDTTLQVTQGEQDLVIILHEIQTYKDAAQVYSKSKTLQSSKMEASAGASPVNKTQIFLDYIKANAAFPVQEQFQPGSRVVHIEFYINKNQRPERIKIISSSGSKKHDEEAIRLLKEGPSWNCAENSFPSQGEFYFFFK